MLPPTTTDLSLVISFVTLCGGWIFGEFAELSPASLALLFCGVLAIITGIVMLALAQRR